MKEWQALVKAKETAGKVNSVLNFVVSNFKALFVIALILFVIFGGRTVCSKINLFGLGVKALENKIPNWFNTELEKQSEAYKELIQTELDKRVFSKDSMKKYLGEMRHEIRGLKRLITNIQYRPDEPTVRVDSFVQFYYDTLMLMYRLKYDPKSGKVTYWGIKDSPPIITLPRTRSVGWYRPFEINPGKDDMVTTSTRSPFHVGLTAKAGYTWFDANSLPPAFEWDKIKTILGAKLYLNNKFLGVFYNPIKGEAYACFGIDFIR